MARGPETAAPAGAYLMTEQSWLTACSAYAPEAPLARRIYKTTSGRHYVPVEADRQDILSLRRDERLAALLTRRMAHDNRAVLAQRLGRQPTAGELYIAHLFGAEATLRLTGQRGIAETDVEGLRAAGLPVSGMTGQDVARMLRLAVDLPLERAATATAMAHLRPQIPDGAPAQVLARGRSQDGNARLGARH
jgi:hypothetical protein